ncbi:RNA-dependent RNA polymerase [Chobar Gorge virus]|uniref:RNA-directed RNA polymerase n=1 Tax=Chobar Gorge virus TaxID=1679172 RepID=A0A0H4MKD5_9REOV|nr:RNA-dependent RNA polymerase [Chobar Gorge virus]AKP24097.1 RNA-dependent RNA polymerase [Chobar Gorge virus]
MAAVVQQARIVERALELLLQRSIGTSRVFEFYKYSKWKESSSEKRDSLYGIPVISEATWEQLVDDSMLTEMGNDAWEIYCTSLRESCELQPEEEFLRNYKLEGRPHAFDDFIRARGREESQTYGDLALRHWFALLVAISQTERLVPLGMSALAVCIREIGEPFHQNTRDLSKFESEKLSSSIVLYAEMCLAESLQEFNVFYRSKEEGVAISVACDGVSIDAVSLIREFFLACLPHPKRVCNMLRAAYTWFVKNWGTGVDEAVVLQSRAGDDRNAKDVHYTGYATVRNPYGRVVLQTRFHREARNANQKKVSEVEEYIRTLVPCHQGLPLLTRLLRSVYRLPFSPRNISHVIFASVCLSIQTITGYGRAWVKNVGDDPAKIVLPAPDNYVDRLATGTELNFRRAYAEALRHGYDMVPPEDMYTSLLRLAKNTSSGIATSVTVRKDYGPRAAKRAEFVKITSRQKALVIMTHGDKIYTPEHLMVKYNTPQRYQTKGSRDVPIKATRTIYAIHLGVLAPQLILTLPLNEYFAKAGGPTHPAAAEIGGKIIIGDLEATGSRLIDAADTFRNTGDPEIMTLALDYSEYDSHMSQHNFRSGMIRAIRGASAVHSAWRYDGYSLDQLIDFAYGDGRITGTLWNGRRSVMRVSRSLYESLPESDRCPPADAPFRFTPPGVKPIRTLGLLPQSEHADSLLVSPWDGSDLAYVTTHLSGENSTLVANSLHNLAIGRIIQEELAIQAPGVVEVLSEMYVGDDTLMYTRLLTHDVRRIDKAIDVIFDTVKKCGHEASPSKTTYLPLSAEKTQTHAKHGIYIPQDRMMLISSERRKDIESIRSYVRGQINVLVTKISRGFSEFLAHLILMMKTSLIGYRKLKRTIKDGIYRSRSYHSDREDGYTLCRVRHPLVTYAPYAFGGVGAHPEALNIVNTPELFLESLLEGSPWASLVLPYCVASDDWWDETQADKRQIGTETPMSLFSRLARRTVTAALSTPEIRAQVASLPLQGLGPTRLSATMMHGALLKEARARALLSPGYETDYQRALNATAQRPSFSVRGGDLELSTAYSKIFTIWVHLEGAQPAHPHPDLNLSPSFRLQRTSLGTRWGPRLRMSYVDRIDAMVRADVVMRGFVTAQHIMRVLEEIGIDHSTEDLTTIFSLMNLEERVARRIAEYVTKDRVRFDALSLNKGGIAGDEFTMSLDVATQTMVDQKLRFPNELTKTEIDAIALHGSQIMMLRAARGACVSYIEFQVRPEHRAAFRRERVAQRTPRRRMLRTLCADVRTLSALQSAHQFT